MFNIKNIIIITLLQKHYPYSRINLINNNNNIFFYELNFPNTYYSNLSNNNILLLKNKNISTESYIKLYNLLYWTCFEHNINY
jgi:hypothetical protein